MHPMDALTTLPGIWGAGQLLAFSGIDGLTDWRRPFVLHTGEVPGVFVVRLPHRAAVAFRRLQPPVFDCILGDVLTARTSGGAFRMAFLDHHTLTGELPPGAEFILEGRTVATTPVEARLGDGVATLWGCRRGARWVLLIDFPGANEPGVAARLEAALGADVDATVAQRQAYVRRLAVPGGLSPERQRLLRKAVAVMKVNVEAPCGKIARRWTTPDRWPHRFMWLWDSAFHAVGFAAFDPALARDAVMAMVDQVGPDGMLSHMVGPDGPASGITQPPILSWAVARVVQAGGDREWARPCLDLLHRQLAWVSRHRDRNGNGIPEWMMEGNVDCRSGESGADNCSRFDGGEPLDAPDYAGYLFNDWTCLAGLARQFGEEGLARACERAAGRVAEAVEATLWSAEDGFYLDRTLQGAFVRVKANTGFVPLFAGIASAERAEALRQHLANPRTFGSPVPVPSVSLDSGSFCKDMWRGPAWVNLNYMTCLGLRRYGFSEAADRLKEATLAEIQRWYEQEGCLFEFYDALGLTSPRDLDRKRRLVTGQGMAPISDYHWTAALTAAWLME